MVWRIGPGRAVLLGLAGLAGVIAGRPAVTARAVGAAQAPGSGVSSGEAAAILSAARDALGGDKRISSIKTLVTSGRTQQVQGDNLVPIEFEITIELPDKYVRTDEIPARESGPTSRGFNGNDLIQVGDATGGGRRGGPPPPGPPPNPTAPVKQDFARLMLGMFATSFSSYPLTFGYVGQAEAPEGKADVIEVKGEGFTARLFIDSRTHLPLMLSWTAPPNLVPVARGQPPPVNLAPGSVTFATPAPPSASASAEEKKQFEDEALAARAAAMKSARPTEHRMYYADYREVEGVKFPFRIRRAIGATTTEETIFDRFRINARVDRRRFEVRR
jgi:hypothetical protein